MSDSVQTKQLDRSEYQREYQRQRRAKLNATNPQPKPDGRKGAKRPNLSARLKGKPNTKALKDDVLIRLHVSKGLMGFVDRYLFMSQGIEKPTERERREVIETYLDYTSVELEVKDLIGYMEHPPITE